VPEELALVPRALGARRARAGLGDQARVRRVERRLGELERELGEDDALGVAEAMPARALQRFELELVARDAREEDRVGRVDLALEEGLAHGLRERAELEPAVDVADRLPDPRGQGRDRHPVFLRELLEG